MQAEQVIMYNPRQ